ncbi:hypothetical protein EYF80_037716 [Liparis tanakae]|uniref:Uncharacterized protein n=1 Tax=Liparis tanakae TaxID=230148 RepID=A0A4Z2GEY5_9TELE|nr:hypothetical protein EYF80_037716 [Liparis tanakae]
MEEPDMEATVRTVRLASAQSSPPPPWPPLRLSGKLKESRITGPPRREGSGCGSGASVKLDQIKRAEVEEALKPERTTFTELQHRGDLITSALDTERARCEKQRIELKEALIRQIETLEVKQTLAVALQKAQDDISKLHGQHLGESSIQIGHISDTKLRLNQQRNALDESTKALHHL